MSFLSLKFRKDEAVSDHGLHLTSGYLQNFP